MHVTLTLLSLALHLATGSTVDVDFSRIETADEVRTILERVESGGLAAHAAVKAVGEVELQIIANKACGCFGVPLNAGEVALRLAVKGSSAEREAFGAALIAGELRGLFSVQIVSSDLVIAEGAPVSILGRFSGDDEDAYRAAIAASYEKAAADRIRAVEQAADARIAAAEKAAAARVAAAEQAADARVAAALAAASSATPSPDAAVAPAATATAIKPTAVPPPADATSAAASQG